MYQREHLLELRHVFYTNSCLTLGKPLCPVVSLGNKLEDIGYNP